MVEKNNHQLQLDVLPLLEIVSLEKTALWMNWFYGYESDEAV
jgi:hypothetical protein